MLKRLIIVADDFTGANDTGVQFRKAGLKVNVIINAHRFEEELKNSDVLVIDLESRFDTKEIAYQKCFDLGKQLIKLENTTVYKKLDSTFRGNIGAEIDGLMDSLQITKLLLAPAWPSNGRTTENGEIFVHGVKLAETEAANDPRNPVRFSRIADIIGLQSRRTCTEIPARMIREGLFDPSEILVNTSAQEPEIFIFDSLLENDLELISNFIGNLSNNSILLAGSAGLASHLSEISSLHKSRLSFVFCGSISERSRTQMKHALKEGHCILKFIDGEYLLNDDYNPDKLTASVSEDIEKGIRRFIFTSASSVSDVERVFILAEKISISKESAAEKVAIGIGNMAATLIEKFQPSGVLLTGGDIAIKTVQALHATGINIDREILPGIASGVLTGCTIRSIIATKSGAFGSDDAITKTLEFFEE
jgi:uncharacterized protein YgbK (DUF1537 family)